MRFKAPSNYTGPSETSDPASESEREGEDKVKEIPGPSSASALPHSLLDDYELLDLLGEGSSGNVRSGRRLIDDLHVAIKTLPKNRLHAKMNDEELGDIPMEAWIMKNIRHPCVIGFVDLFENDDCYFIIMELHGIVWSKTNPLLVYEQGTDNDVEDDDSAPRRDLFDCVRFYGHLTEDTARVIFIQMADCVYFLHRHGICHGDIKDENITIDKEYHVKLIDFGSSTLTDNTKDPMFRGTPGWASPEVLMAKYTGKPWASAPVDMWALGILLYILVFGEFPFSSDEEIIHFKVMTNSAIRVSSPCVELITWLLQKDPRRRPTSKQVCSHKWITRQVRTTKAMTPRGWESQK